MLAIKVLLKNAEKVKKILLKNKLLNFNYSFSKDERYIYFPIKKRSNEISKYKIVQKKLKRKAVKKSFRDLLSKSLTVEEFDRVKTAFDMVGDIAILEVDKDLRKKEKRIAEALLKSNKNINTVLRKEGKHSGSYRTQKMRFLAGKDKRITVHKENNVKLKLDIEKVYFSVRLSTERKRIMQQVKKGEEVLVMFSGCGPYPFVLSKNTNARQTYGIELNPEAHKYALENQHLNKADNVFLINGNVKDVVPKFYHYNIGLKSSTNPKQLKTKLKHKPRILELHTERADFYENYSGLKKTITSLKKQGIILWLHQPIIQNPRLDLTNFGSTHPIYRKMLRLAEQFDVNLTIHPSNAAPSETPLDTIIKNIRSFNKHYDKTYFENSFEGTFIYKEEILRAIKESALKNFCIDISHALCHYGNDGTVKMIKNIQQLCNTYFHVNDYRQDDSDSLYDKSNVDLKRILPLITKGVIEVRDHDPNNPKDMISSFNYLLNFQKKFDRILMPLPKSAEDFLDTALLAARKGTTIHFYDFLHEDNFVEAHKKIEKACRRNNKRFKILKTVRCGQHSPKTYRICVDFQIL